MQPCLSQSARAKPLVSPISRSLTETDFTATIQQGSVAVSNQLAHCETITHQCHIAQASHPGQAISNLTDQTPRFFVGVSMLVRFPQCVSCHLYQGVRFA